MQSNYQVLGYVIAVAFAVLALWLVFGERLSPRAGGPQPYEVPPGTTPRQLEPAPSNPPR